MFVLTVSNGLHSHLALVALWSLALPEAVFSAATLSLKGGDRRHICLADSPSHRRSTVGRHRIFFLFSLQKLPVTVPVLLRFLMLCITAVLVDVFVTPYFLIVVVFVAAAYYYIQSFFRCSSR